MVSVALRSSSSTSVSSHGNLLQAWPSASSMTSNFNSSNTNNNKQQSAAAAAPITRQIPAKSKFTVMEYGPDSGSAKSWPHTEWDDLAALLDPESFADGGIHELPPPPTTTTLDDNNINNNTAGANESEGGGDGTTTTKAATSQSAVTYRRDGPSSSRDSGATMRSSVASVGSVNSLSSSNNKTNINSSAFHIVALSDWVSIVAMVKGEEQRWSRRRTPLSDQDIRGFLNDMASKLRVSQQFTSSNIPPPLQSDKDRKLSFDKLNASREESLLSTTESPFAWTDIATRTFLRHVKETFELRPTTSSRGLASFSSGREGLAAAQRRASYMRRSSSDEGFSGGIIIGSNGNTIINTNDRNRSSSFSGILSNHNRSKKNRLLDANDSGAAAIFFLGSELARSFG